VSPIFTGETPGYPPYLSYLSFVAAEPLLNGDPGVAQTIAVMRQLVDEALRDPSIIRLATDIVRHVAAFDDLAEANALYEWVRRNIRFTKDPVNKEKLYPPAELLKIRAGDCDDISMLLATLLMAVGYPARLMTIAAPNSPDSFSHVYVEAEIPAGSNQWIPLDPARADSQFGVAPPAFTRARWWSLTDSSFGDLSGTKIFAHPGATVHVNLGNYPRFRSHLGSYGAVRRLGDTTPASGDSTSSLIATTGQAASDIIRASQGIPASPFSYQSGPWSSFATPYTPGVTLGPGGYGAPNVALTASNKWILWAALGIGALVLFGGRR
jgi:Transglutaminase-like superfamily